MQLQTLQKLKLVKSHSCHVHLQTKQRHHTHHQLANQPLSKNTFLSPSRLEHWPFTPSMLFLVLLLSENTAFCISQPAADKCVHGPRISCSPHLVWKRNINLAQAASQSYCKLNSRNYIILCSFLSKAGLFNRQLPSNNKED